MQEKLDTALFNVINASALGVTFVEVQQTLTLLVLGTALLYNIKKLTKK